MPPILPPYLYYISIVLQAICVLHCLRKGNPGKWVWVIIFLPYIGCLVYFFSEIVPVHSVRGWQPGTFGLLGAKSRIRRLENHLRFADTFNNRVMLADTYLAVGRTDEAIELYASALTGAFTENEYVIKQLIRAYFQEQQYAEVVTMARKIYSRPQFARSKEHVLYARALAYLEKTSEAEQEYLKMKARFADFEARFQYGLFLRERGREKDARLVFEDITGEAAHLSARERRDNRAWITKAKEELKKA
jgi:hypothetical protein